MPSYRNENIRSLFPSNLLNHRGLIIVYLFLSSIGGELKCCSSARLNNDDSLNSLSSNAIKSGSIATATTAMTKQRRRRLNQGQNNKNLRRNNNNNNHNNNRQRNNNNNHNNNRQRNNNNNNNRQRNHRNNNNNNQRNHNNNRNNNRHNNNHATTTTTTETTAATSTPPINELNLIELSHILPMEDPSTLKKAFDSIASIDEDDDYSSFGINIFQADLTTSDVVDDPDVLLTQDVYDAWTLALQNENNGDSNNQRRRRRRRRRRRQLTTTGGITNGSPFLCCYDDDNNNNNNNRNKETISSGYERLQSIATRLFASSSSSDDDVDTIRLVRPLYNTKYRTCVSFHTTASKALELLSSSSQGGHFKILPYVPSMKVEAGAIDTINDWFDHDGYYEGVKISEHADEEEMRQRVFNVRLSPTLCPPSSNNNNNNINGNRRRNNNNHNNSHNTRTTMTTTVFDDVIHNAKEEREHIHLSRRRRRRRRTNENNNDNNNNNDIFSTATYLTDDITCSMSVQFSSSSSSSLTTKKEELFLALEALVRQSEVISVSALPFLEIENANINDAISILQGGGGNDGVDNGWKPFWDMNITGLGQVVAVSDTGIDLYNCYFSEKNGPIITDGRIDKTKRKVIQYIPASSHPEFRKDYYRGHGTHVAATIAGSSSSDVVGIAPDAKLSFFDLGLGARLSLPPTVHGLLSPGHRHAHASIHSASWGCGAYACLNRYAAMSHAFDEYLYNNPDFLVVVAAGNRGGYGVSWPGTAKNVVTVGATYNDRNENVVVAGISGRGYCSGDRPCVDVVAPGSPIRSAMGGTACGTMDMSGTSMATPLVAGSVALVRDYFEQFGLDSPSGPLTKALLLNGGRRCDTGRVYDGTQGFGRVDLGQSLPVYGLNNFGAMFFDKVEISVKQTIEVNITIDDYLYNFNSTQNCTTPLSVTVAWFDFPGSTLLNDLDLLITSVDDGEAYFPNGRQEKDTVNNVERIQIDAKTAMEKGHFVVSVEASNLITKTTTYAMAITGCLAGDDVIITSDTAW